MVNPTTRHTFTYVPDLARAAVAVAEAGESAWGRAWHCPNAPPQSTIDIAQQVAGICGREKPVKSVVLKVREWDRGRHCMYVFMC